MDSSSILSEEQKAQLYELIQNIEDSTNAQVAVVLVQSLRGRDINKYSIQVAQGLSLGRYEYNDGVLLTIALQDRSARIEVGTGLETILPDEIAARILREEMIPEFSEGKYFRGVSNGIRALGRRIIASHSETSERP